MRLLDAAQCRLAAARGLLWRLRHRRRERWSTRVGGGLALGLGLNAGLRALGVEGHAMPGFARVERVDVGDRQRDLSRHAAEARRKLDQLVAHLQLVDGVGTDAERDLA